MKLVKLFFIFSILFSSVAFADIEVTGKFAPKNDGFRGIVEGDQILDENTTSGNIFISDGVGFNSVTMSGEATINSTGVLDIGPDIVINNISLDDNTSGKILVADGNSFEPVAMSGDVTISSSGITTVDSSFMDNTDEQYLDVHELDGTTLKLSISNDGVETEEIDLSSLQDGTGTDDQTLSFISPNLSIENGNSVNISAIDTDTTCDGQSCDFVEVNISGDLTVVGDVTISGGDIIGAGYAQIDIGEQDADGITFTTTRDNSEYVDFSCRDADSTTYCQYNTGLYVATGNLIVNDIITARGGITNDGEEISFLESSGGYVFNIDKDNGDETNDSFKFCTDSSGTTCSTPLMTLLDGGNVGIGVTAPTDALEISADTNKNIRFGDVASGYSTVAYITDLAKLGSIMSLQRPFDGAWQHSIFTYATSADGSGSQNLGITSRNATVFVAGEAERVRIDNNGNVGIGTSAPGYALEVNSGTNDIVAKLVSTDANAYLYLTDNAGTASWSTNAGTFIFDAPDNKDFIWRDAFVEQMRLDTSVPGLGIGTNAPKNRLDVEGAVAIGASYSGTSTGPANGLIVQGNTGIGVSAVTSGATLHVRNNDNGADTHYGILVDDNTGNQNNSGVKVDLDANSDVAYGFYSDVSGASAGNYAFFAYDGESYFADNVGIGYSDPGAKLVVDGNIGIGRSTTSYALHVEGAVQADDFYSGDGSQGLTTTITWTDETVGEELTLTVKDGLITGFSSVPFSCFISGTSILMADGILKNIEDVQVGDFVKGYDESSGIVKDVEVLKLEQPVRDHYIIVEFDDESQLGFTDEHPVYVPSKGWASINPEATKKERKDLRVVQLELGDEVLTPSGTKQIIGWMRVNGNVQTYNLERVAETENFFAGGVLAHNKCLIAGTLINTPSGQIRIEDLKIGDVVFGFDDGGMVVSEIVNTYKKEMLDKIDGVVLPNGSIVTHNHIVEYNGNFVEAGKTMYQKIKIDAAVYDIRTKSGNYFINGIKTIWR